MNIENPKLSTDWTDEELNHQTDLWQTIMKVSGEISDAATCSNWTDLQPMAEERQVLIDEFFELTICLPLFHQIMADLGEMQAQHQQVLVELKRGMDQNHAKHLSLSETKASIQQYFGTMDGHNERTSN